MKNLLFFILYFFCNIFINGLQSQNLNLVVTGNSNNETTIIDSLGYKKQFSNFKLLKSEINILKSQLEEIGYIDIELLETKKTNDSTYHTKFNLGSKINTIYIYYNKSVISKSILQLITKDVFESYFITNIKDVKSILLNINSHLINKGYPFSSVTLSAIKKQNSNKSLDANLVVDLNTERTIDNIIIKGYENFPKSYLKHYLKLNSKEALNINSLKEKTKTLNTLPFANTVREPEILFTKDSSSVYLYIEKRKSNTFDGFLGFGTNETNNKLEFDGYLDVSLTNNLNYGESFNLMYKSDENEQKTFNVNINAPYIFNSPIGIELALNIFKKDSTFTTINQSGSLFYQLNNQQKVFLGIETIESNSQSNTTSFDIEDYNTTLYNIRYILTKPQPNNTIFTNSFKLDIKTGIGKRNSLNAKTKQYFYDVNTYKNFTLNRKNSLFLRINLKGIESNNYLYNELLRFGGINSIRGFEENSLVATSYGYLNLEYRYSLSPLIYIHTITDVAHLNNSIGNLKENLYSLGFGLGVLTKAGLLKLNYANGKNKEQQFKFSNSKFHISLSTNF